MKKNRLNSNQAGLFLAALAAASQEAVSYGVSSVASLEGFGDNSQVDAARMGILNTLRTSAQAEGHDVAFLDTPGMQASLEAAQMVLASGNILGSYHKSAMSYQRGTLPDGFELIDNSGSQIGVTSFSNASPALEAFDEQELRNHLPMSSAFNALASVQDEMSALFFPTVTLDPSQPGLDLSIRRTMILREFRHQVTGAVQDMDKDNLIDAVVDHRKLANEANRIHPVLIAAGGNANTGNFATGITYNVTLDTGEVIPSAPLAIGKAIDLLGLANNGSIQVQGSTDHTDSIDPGMRIETVYLKIVAGGNTSYVAVNTLRAPRNQFHKSVEGRGRALTLAFDPAELIVSANTDEWDGSAALGLTYLQQVGREAFRVVLGTTLTGSADTETGKISVNATPLSVVRVMDGDEDVTATEAAPFLASLTSMEVVGYRAYATRSAQNLRMRGLILNPTVVGERYTVNFSAPISVQSPISNNGAEDAASLASLVNAAMIRRANDGVTVVLNHVESLRENTAPVGSNGYAAPAVEGIGRFAVKQAFQAISLDAYDSLMTLNSSGRRADVNALLTDTVRDVALNLIRDSRFQAALDAHVGPGMDKPKVIILTDNVISKYLMTSGDTRTFGDGLDYEVAVSLDDRVKGKIIVGITRANGQAGDPLTYGLLAWVPELVTAVQLNFGGSTTRHLMVQPRYRHVLNLPVAGEITVTNLSQAVRDSVAIKTFESNPEMVPVVAGP